MKKIIVTLALVVVMSLSCVLCASCGQKKVEGSEGLQYTLSEDGEYYILTGLGTFQGKDLVVGNTYNGLPVKEIGEAPFTNSENADAINGIETITISEGIETFGFRWCRTRSAKKIILPDGVKVLGKASFILGKTIEEIVIGKGLEKIEMDSFLEANPNIKIYFRGSEEDWKKVEVEAQGNELLETYTIVYNYKD